MVKTQRHVARVMLIITASLGIASLAWAQKIDTRQDQKEETKVTVSGELKVEPVFRDTDITRLRGGGNEVPQDDAESFLSYERLDTLVILDDQVYGIDLDSNYLSVQVYGGVDFTVGSGAMKNNLELALRFGFQRLDEDFGFVGAGGNPSGEEWGAVFGPLFGKDPSEFQPTPSAPSDPMLIKDMPHHGHIRDTPYEGHWIVNTGEVPVEVSFIDKDGARTVIPEFRPGLATGIPLNATNISLQPVGEGNFSARIEKTDETTIMQVNTPGTYAIPEVPLPPPQPATPAISAFDAFDAIQGGFGASTDATGPDARGIQTPETSGSTDQPASSHSSEPCDK